MTLVLLANVLPVLSQFSLIFFSEFLIEEITNDGLCKQKKTTVHHTKKILTYLAF